MTRLLFSIYIAITIVVREKQIEIEQELSMLRDRGTKDFFYSSLQLFGGVDTELAVLSEYLVGGLILPRLRLLAARIYATKTMIDGASFIETFRELCHSSGFAQRIAYTVTARIYCSGGLTKDAVYLRGLEKILKYIGDGRGLEPLFVGKISAWHIPIIKELESRQVLRPVTQQHVWLCGP